jgi:ubiquilin
MATDNLTIHLTVTGADGAPRVPLSISTSINAADLRQEASAKTKIPLSSLKIIFRGRLIADDASKLAVSEYKLEDGSVVHCMGKPAETALPVPAASAVANNNNNNSNSNASAPAATAPTQPTLNFMPPSAAAPAATIPATATPADPLQAALQQIRSSCSPADYLTAVTTLEKVVSNITDNPMEEKYRKVKKANAAFQRRLGGRPGGDAAKAPRKNLYITLDIRNKSWILPLNTTFQPGVSLLIRRGAIF